MRLNALAEKLQFRYAQSVGSKEKSPSYRKVCAADRLWRRGIFRYALFALNGLCKRITVLFSERLQDFQKAKSATP